MTREFVIMPEFDRQWRKMGLSDTELRQLQEILLQNPKAGNVIQGTNGLRKLRIAFEGQGKRGSGRVAYVDFTAHKVIYLITAYPKNEKDNLSKAERNNIAKIIIRLEHSLQDDKKSTRTGERAIEIIRRVESSEKLVAWQKTLQGEEGKK